MSHDQYVDMLTLLRGSGGAAIPAAQRVGLITLVGRVRAQDEIIRITEHHTQLGLESPLVTRVADPTVFVVMLYRCDGTQLHGVYGDIASAAYDAAAVDIKENIHDVTKDPNPAVWATANLATALAGPMTDDDAERFLDKWREDTRTCKAALIAMLNNTAVVVEKRRVVSTTEPGDVEAIREWRL